MTKNHIALFAVAVLAVCRSSSAQTTSFSGEVTIAPGSNPSILPNLFIGNTAGTEGDEISYDSVNARSTSFINVPNGTWRWQRLHSQLTPPAWTPMELSANGKLTLGASVWNPDDEVYEGRSIVLDPQNSQISIDNRPLVTSSSGISSYAAAAGYAFGEGTYSNGNSQTVIGRWNVPLSTVVSPPASAPVFIVGGGTAGVRSNALVVRANGDATFSGRLQAGPSAGAHGAYSTAIGSTVNAYGLASTAMGIYSNAGGAYSFAAGVSNSASADASVAMGGWTFATQYAATAFGGGCAADGVWSFAAGDRSRAAGNGSVAMGGLCVASGHFSQAFGISTAGADYATSFGVSHAAAPYSTTFGQGTYAEAANQTVIGRFNSQSLGALFVVGSGLTAIVRSNAFEVRADGSAHARVLRVPESGDLSMGEFQNGPQPFAN